MMTRDILREAEPVTVQREIGEDRRRERASCPEPEHIVDLVLALSSRRGGRETETAHTRVQSVQTRGNRVDQFD